MNLKDPVLQTYLIAASLMCLKMMLQAWITVYQMIKVNGGFLHPEDIKKTPLNPNPSPDQLTPNPDVERSRSMQRNDMENIPVFLVVGFLFTLTQPALWVTQILMYGYVTSRLLHAYALGTAKTHDLRAVFFSIASVIVIGMSLYTLVTALKG
jgi:glutathione S-transferase